MFERIGKKAGSGLASAALLAGMTGLAGPASSAASAALTPAQMVQQLLAGVHVGGPNRPAGHLKGLTAYASTNWSGYADDNSGGNSYQKVSGSWTQPSVTCASSSDQEIAAFWAGIDGLSDQTVEQDGTLAYCNNGTISYFDWWEMYPTNAVQVVNLISAGDSMTSSVSFAAGKYKLTVTDHTNPSASFSTSQACGTTACQNASAEWIAERPSGSTGLFVLPDFGKWKVSKASVTSGATKGTIKTFPNDSITMVNSSHQTLVSVSSLSTTGAGFSATWHRSA